MYLGIDIGIRNYAYCIVESITNSSWRIKRWKNVDTGLKKTTGVVKIGERMIKVMQEIFENWDVKVCVIEAQPGKRLIMERVLCYTVAYIQHKFPKTEVHIRRSDKKFSVWREYDGKRRNYLGRKKLAVDIGFMAIKAGAENAKDILPIISGVQKKDDLFDALLLVLKYMGYSFSSGSGIGISSSS